MSSLREKSLLQGGKYRIVKVLGQGGFGITYLAIQSGLERKVAIKEFFMKDLCNRDESTSHVSVGSAGSVDMVERFKAKFLKEARNIAHLNHPYIVRIHDIFEENGTAYYVMEYAGNGSLADKVKQQGQLSESVAKRYILQVADALAYIHRQKMIHLDVKPANIMLSEADDAVHIYFGMSKQYDAATGNQTSTSPVGISEGYAPMEQYKQGGVGEFSPETDIYSLGATFFKLLTGITPPSASDVNEDGVPVAELRAKGVSKSCIDTICKAMEVRKKDRIKSIDSFVRLLGNTSVPIPPVLNPVSESNDEEATIVNVQLVPSQEQPIEPPAQQKSSPNTNYVILAITVVVIAIIVAVLWGLGGYTGGETPVPIDDSLACDIVWEDSVCADSVCVDSIPAEFAEQVKPISTLFYVTTSPADVTVYVDGKRIGTTPIEDMEVSIGKHKVKLSKQGYEDMVITRTFGEKPVVLNETLMEKTQQQTSQMSQPSHSSTIGGRRTFTVDGVSFDMMPVSGGTFRMGATKSMDSDADDDESPLHDVTLSDYYIGKTEVTQALWRTVMGTYPSEFRGDNLPVERVSWNDCQEFIRKLNAKTGKDFRLPTEAEWEYAARGGNRSRGYKYSGSDNIDAIAWYDGSSNSKTHPVATKQANELGIYDMSGNVWEWCSDWYGPYGSNAQTNPKGAASGISRVNRGGSWDRNPRLCRPAIRNGYSPGYRFDDVGFRLALPVK